MAENSTQFDPYRKWLGISPKDQPPNHYRLLGIELFESDAEVIDAQANKQMAYLHTCATGQRAALAEQLLNQMAEARLCLLDSNKKSTYDQKLRAKSPKPAKPPQKSSPQRTTPNSTSQQVASTSQPAAMPSIQIEPKPNTVPRQEPSTTNPKMIIAGSIGGVMLVVVVIIIFVMSQSSADPVVTNTENNQTKPTGTEKDDASLPIGTSPSNVNVNNPSEKKDDGEELDATSNAGNFTNNESTNTTPATNDNVNHTTGLPKEDPDSDSPTTNDDSTNQGAEDPPHVAQPLPLKRQQVPLPAAQNDARQRLKDILDVEANGPDEHGERARKLLDAEKEHPDEVERFVILRGAYDHALACGDAALAKQAIGQIVAGYEMDEGDLTAHMYTQLAEMLKPNFEARRMLEEMLKKADELFKNRQLKNISTISTAAEKLAARFEDPRLQLRTRVLSYMSRQLTTQFTGAVISANETIENSPDDPKSNLVLGHYDCLVLGDFKTGLARLVNGDNAAVAELAALDLSAPQDSKERMGLANQWYDLSQSDPAFKAYSIRALLWFSQLGPSTKARSVQSSAKSLLREMLKEDYVDSRSRSGAGDALGLIQTSADIKSYPSIAFLFLVHAHAQALESDDYDLAQQAVESLDEMGVATSPLKIAAVQRRVAKARSVDERRQIVLEIIQASDEAIGESRIEDTTQLLRMALTMVARLKDAELRATIQQKQAFVGELEKWIAKVQEAQQTLEAQPDDPEANLVLGRYSCFIRGDWETGLPHLARSSDDKLSHVAKMELEKPSTNDEYVQLCQNWAAVYEGEDDRFSKARIKDYVVGRIDPIVSKTKGAPRDALDAQLSHFFERGAISDGDVALVSRGSRVYGCNYKPQCLIDGDSTSRDKYAAASAWPCEWVVELYEVCSLREIRMRFYDSENCRYKYTVETSVDGKFFRSLVDRSKEGDEGESWQVIKFPARGVKYIRLRGLGVRNSRLPLYVHELEAYCNPNNALPPN